MTSDERPRGGQAHRLPTPGALADAVRVAAREAGYDAPYDVAVVPAPTGPGWVSPMAMRWAAAARATPVDVAWAVASRLVEQPEVASAEVLGEGMLHLVLTPAASGQVVAAVLSDAAYGRDGRHLPGVSPALPGPGERRRGHPVFGVIWARARSAAAASSAARGGVTCEVDPADLLCSPSEDALLTALAAFPDDVARARDRAALLRRLGDLAGRAHRWLDDDPLVPRSGLEPVGLVHHARAALATATAQVLGTGLDLLGLPAPTQV